MKALTEEHKRRISLSLKGHIPWNKGLTEEIDERVKRNVEGCRKHYRVCKVRRLKHLDDNTIVKLYIENKLSVNRIARMLNCSWGFVGKILGEQGIVLRNRSVYYKVQEFREIMSKVRVKWILENGDIYTHCNFGKFWSDKNKDYLRYRSSLELKVYKILENDMRVVKYKVEPVSVEYFYNGVKCNYIPDLLVDYINSKVIMYEIKPLYQINEERVKLKISFAKRWCIERGYDFKIWTEKGVI